MASLCSSRSWWPCAVVLAALFADGYLRREGLDGPEFYVLMLLSASGGMLMASANDLIVMFLGLEILSIALYVLAGFNRRRGESGEAAMKYFVLGAFSSALFLYGIALVYGATGSTNLPQIAGYLAGNVATANGVLLAGLRSCWWASASRSRPCRSTCGHPTSTRARRPRSPASWPRHRQGGRRSRPSCGCSSRPSPRAARLAAHHLGPGRAHAAGGVRAGRRADRREADAGLLVDQPRRLRPRRPAGGHRPGHGRRALLPAGLHVHGDGQLRHRHPRRPAR